MKSTALALPKIGPNRYTGCMTLLVILALPLAAAALYGYRRQRARQLRADLMETGLTDDEWRIVIREVPVISRLPDRLHGPLRAKISLFLGQVEFIGYDGLEVTDDIALSIAAQACLLVVATDRWYDHLTTVLVYPGAFKSLKLQRDGFVMHEEMVVRSGESWSRGPVVLSWADSRKGAQTTDDGYNVVLHEFAHQLDDLSGHTDGAPVLAEGQSFSRWSRVMLEAYARHEANVAAHRATPLDPYGAENHEEFFAVAVETFFEKPDALFVAEPDLYAELQKLLNLDPKSWP